MKSPDAFKTISEVADELDLPQHVLRFWETRFRQIKPLKRGGGRRYYRPDDVLLLKGIRHLLYAEGYTIKGVQRILKEQGNRFVQAVASGAPLLPSTDEEQIKQAVPVSQLATVSAQGKARAGDSRSQLQAVLTELLECKRLLDQVN
ncbi:MAG: MerR family transcriptional regulator [Rhizobiaceae bacterium]